jgi:hypothetical protein
MRDWPSGEPDNTLEMHQSADPIRPSHWISRYSKPWWLTDFVVDTNGIYAFLREPFEYYLFHLDPSTYAITNQINLSDHALVAEYGLFDCKPVSIAGNDTTLYILYACQGGEYLPYYFRMVVFDVATWTITNAIQMAGTPDYNTTIYKLGGDGVNGYLYSLRYEVGGGSEECILERRYASIAQKFAVESSLNLTQTYYDTGSWEWNPCSDTDPYGSFRIWCLGGDSDRLFAAGVDCVDGDEQPIFYEFDTSTLAYVGKSDICKTIDPVQIVSFW